MSQEPIDRVDEVWTDSVKAKPEIPSQVEKDTGNFKPIYVKLTTSTPVSFWSDVIYRYATIYAANAELVAIGQAVIADPTTGNVGEATYVPATGHVTIPMQGQKQLTLKPIASHSDICILWHDDPHVKF